VRPFTTLRRICHTAVAEGVVPGLVIAVQVGGELVFQEGFGVQALPDAPGRPPPATPETVYDLASLTKALVTSVLAMQGVDAAVLRLDDLLTAARPDAGSLRLALAHAAGFPAHRPYYQAVDADLRAATVPPELRARVVALAAREPLAYPPGSRSLYSDCGFILLGDALERALGARLDALAAERIVARLGIEALGYLAGGGAATAFGGRPIAPTERCPVRGRLLVGEVHDLNAYVMGGVAAHAGLFGTAGAVAAVARALCAAWRDAGAEGGPALVSGPVLRAFWTAAGIPGSSWRLGWDGPSLHGSLAGDRISRAAVGHLGFTGCSLWIDPERESFVATLSNRVHPTVRDDPRFRALRPALNDAALEDGGY
jgi:CubicO group peptidase (beta-lactamase class C family)